MNDYQFKIGMARITPLLPNFDMEESEGWMKGLYNILKLIIAGDRFEAVCIEVAKGLSNRKPTVKDFTKAYARINEHNRQEQPGPEPMTRAESNLWILDEIENRYSSVAAQKMLKSEKFQKANFDQVVIDALMEKSCEASK